MTPLDPIPEPSSVQLTRMEGVLNLINHQLGELVRRVNNQEERLGTVELKVQRLADAAIADKLTVKQTADALRDAKEATEAQARAEALKADQTWTPITRVFAVATTISTVLGVYFAIAR
jgi:hypothetical protein